MPAFVISKEGPRSVNEGSLTEKPPDFSDWVVSKAFEDEDHSLYSKTDFYKKHVIITEEKNL